MKNKKAAMEMSMGTIVTIVLLMSVLVLGIFFVQKIFGSGNDAIDQIDNQVQNEINKLFSEDGTRMVVYPSSQEVTIKKGEDTKGFGFSVMNDEPDTQSFIWAVESEASYDFKGKCGPTMTKEKADAFILLSSKTFSLGPSQKMTRAELVKLKVPSSSPSCDIPYTITVKTGAGIPYDSATMYVTIK